MLLNGRRNIPACAGKTYYTTSQQNTSAEHPRVRGENLYGRPGVGKTPGTSPRARGKRAEKPAYQNFRRNIPACAGKTEAPTANHGSCPEHPRVRGENLQAQKPGGKKFGTSPRARGKLLVHGEHGLVKRNIPACAGKTRSQRTV